MSSRAGVRIAIVGIFAVLVTAFTVADVRSQPGRPGGIAGRPGGVTGMPGGVTGRPPGFGTPGGITGISGIPRPPGGIGNMPGPPRFETVWTCGKCKAELARGNARPSLNSCPRCGVKFINGGGGGAGGFGLVSPPPAAPADPDLMPRGSGNTQGFTAPPVSNSNESVRPAPDSSSSSSEGTSKTGSLILKIMIGVFGFLFLLGIVGGTILIISANKGSKPARKNRRKALELDDDDD